MDISSKYMGDDMVLLLGLNDAKAKQLIQEESHGMPPLFYSLQKWNLSLRPDYTLTWVQCWGIPILAWDSTKIRQIVSIMGEMVEVDDEVDECRKLDRARVLIKTPWKPAIQHTVAVHIDSEVYHVRILEGCGNNSAMCQCRRSRGTGSSEEEIDSDGSFMASPTSVRTMMMEMEDGASQLGAQPNKEDPRQKEWRGAGNSAEDQSSQLPSGPPEGSSMGLPTSGRIIAPEMEDDAWQLRTQPNIMVPRRKQGKGEGDGVDDQPSRLPSGQTETQRPLGNGKSPRTKAQQQKSNEGQTKSGKGEERTAGGPRRSACTMFDEEKSEDGRGKSAGRDNGTARKEKSFKGESSLVDNRGYVAGNFRREEKGVKGRDGEELDSSTEMGFTTYTPIKTQSVKECSPQNKKTDSAISWKVYSRTRRYKKQVQDGNANYEAQTNGLVIHTTPTQQQQNKESTQQQQIMATDKG